MSFYDLSKEERQKKYTEIRNELNNGLHTNNLSIPYHYFNDPDTYIRKAGYLGIGKLWNESIKNKAPILFLLNALIKDPSHHVRQTTINAAGEIAKTDFSEVEALFEYGLKDKHHSVKNAVQGSLKKSGERNPDAIIAFSKKHICDENPEVRRQIVHGLELRGRTHPEDILPLLKQLQFESHKRVRPMIIHVCGQISYKKGCLEKVTNALLTWEDVPLAKACFQEIIAQHHHINNHFRTIETLSPQACEAYLSQKVKGSHFDF
ncbi:MAG: HEAT repeat domain-containing protein [Eubacteriaceae bacterium]